MNCVKKIVIIGPESTGKSTLCEQLAQHYKTVWCNEFAREYLHKNGTNYKVEDLLLIAKGQLALEAETMLKNSSSLLFIDTDLYVIKVWSEYVFGVCDFFILDQIVKKQYDGYLLCDIDLPWVKDELREYPDEKPRQELFSMYKDLLIHQSTPWALISGGYDDRLQNAIKVVDGWNEL
ncbi:MAG: ATPase [Sphingobacteriia bacterium]|nr:MAG: ATPase [Sphingobacteriia bacterium]